MVKNKDSNSTGALLNPPIFHEQAPLNQNFHYIIFRKFFALLLNSKKLKFKNRTIGNQISRSNMTRKWLKTSAKINLHSLWLQAHWTNDNPGLSTNNQILPKLKLFVKQKQLTSWFYLHDLNCANKKTT